MANNIDYAENWLEAMKIIAQKEVEKVAFDTTIDAIIIDSSRAKEGIYLVSTGGNVNFTAYSSDTTYKKNDMVMVTVPQGDYSKQKIIIGKQADENSPAVSIQSPFQQLTNITNNLINENNVIEIQANNTYSWDINTPFNSNNPIWSWEAGSEENIEENKYTRIGLKASFLTSLEEYDVVNGNYGLALILGYKNTEKEESENNLFFRLMTLDSDDFFGNQYKFNIYSTQEAVFDISEYQDFQLEKISLFAYQRNNFKNSKNEIISYTDDNQPNIFIKDCFICLGISTDDFLSDSVEIITKDKKTYNENEENKKTLKLRWIHKDPDNGNISVIDNLPSGYEIRWYRNKLGAAAPDAFAGAHWERFYGCNENSDNQGDYGTKAEEENSEQLEGKFEDIEFIPNINKQTEQLMVIILKQSDVNNVNSSLDNDFFIVAKSPILTFTNDKRVSNNTTIQDLNALGIKYEDTEKGNYFVYNRARQIYSDKQNEIRFLTAVFDKNNDNIENKKPLSNEPFKSIKWIFPANNTMIIPYTTIEEDRQVVRQSSIGSNNRIVIYGNDDSNYKIYYNKIDDTFEYELNLDKKDLYQVCYSIDKSLDFKKNRNTVRLEVNISGQIYTAKTDMVFGTAGTSGSDYTLVIKLEDGGVFDINKSSLSGEVRLYNQGEEVDLALAEKPDNNNNPRYEYQWYKIKSPKKTFERVKEASGRDLYYPIVDSQLLPMKKRLQNNNNAWGNIGGAEALIEESPLYYTYDTNNYYSDSISCYDLTNKKFTKEGISNNSKIKYAQSKHQEDYYKIVYKKFDRVITQSDPEYNENLAGCIDYTETGEKIYYYDTKRKAYINFKGVYIIDPWDQYYEDVEYYEPVYYEQEAYNNQFLQVSSNGGNYQEKFIISKPNGLNIDMSDLYILEVKLTNFGDYDLITRYPIPLKQSDINNNKRFIIDYIEGPTTVRYDCSGELDFEKKPYTLYMKVIQEDGTYKQLESGVYDENNNLEIKGYWKKIPMNDSIDNSYNEIAASSGTSEKISKIMSLIDNTYILYMVYTCINQANGSWNNFIGKYLIPQNVSYLEHSTSSEYYTNLNNINKDTVREDINSYFSDLFNNPSIEENILIKDFLQQLKKVFLVKTDYLFDDLREKPVLNPPTVYFEESSLSGIQFVLDEDLKDYNNEATIINSGTVLWTQPIYMYQDNYPSETLNRWSGKEITTDNDTGVISANGFSAGKKENDNSFTGVVIGDWSRTNTDEAITKQTGIYGFEHGAMSYALKDDGTAFFGKDGKGRIYLNGNSAQIYSAQWIQEEALLDVNNNLTGEFKYKQLGMMLDIDDGIFFSKGENHVETYIAPGEFRLSGMSATEQDEMIDILSIKTDENEPKFLLQSQNYIEPTDSHRGSGLQIDLVNGNIIGTDTEIRLDKGFQGSSTKMIFNSQSNSSSFIDILSVNNNLMFSVTETGILTCWDINCNGNIICTNNNSNNGIISCNKIIIDELYLTIAGVKYRPSNDQYGNVTWSVI